MTLQHRPILPVLAAAILWSVALSTAQAEDKFPTRPIQLIVPTAPGGGTDVAARLLASIAESELHQKILVLNKPGAGGAIGVQAMLDAPHDGYTIGGVWNSPMTVTPQMFKVSYNQDSYVPIVLSDISPIVFCVQKDFPATDGKSFIQELKAHPDKYTYGTDGVSGTVHLGGELIFSSLGVKARAIPYAGAGETLESFLGNHIDIYGGSIPPILPFVQKGTAKCLLVTTDDPNKMLPGASSVTDLGIPQDQTILWHAIVAPAGIPADRLTILEHAFQTAARSDKYQAFAAKQGETAVGWGSKESEDAIKKEYVAFGKVVADLGLAKKDAAPQ